MDIFIPLKVKFEKAEKYTPFTPDDCLDIPERRIRDLVKQYGEDVNLIFDISWKNEKRCIKAKVILDTLEREIANERKGLTNYNTRTVISRVTYDNIKMINLNRNICQRI